MFSSCSPSLFLEAGFVTFVLCPPRFCPLYSSIYMLFWAVQWYTLLETIALLRGEMRPALVHTVWLVVSQPVAVSPTHLLPSPQQIRDLLLARVSGVLRQSGKKSDDIFAVLSYRIVCGAGEQRGTCINWPFSCKFGCRSASMISRKQTRGALGILPAELLSQCRTRR